MNKKEVVKSVVGQMLNMYYNNVINDFGNESFEGWCVEQFETQEEIDFMKTIAPIVDKLTNAIQKELDK